MWDQRYAEEGFAYGTEPNDFLVASVDALSSPVLCLAEGEGRNAVWLAARGLEVTAVDASRVGLDKAERLAAERGVSLRTVHADLADYAIAPGAWGGVVSIWCHVPEALRRRLHADAVRGLRPGGALVLEAYTPAQIALGTGGPKDPSMLMTAEGLADELRGLELVIAREIEREVHEGRYHRGRSAVVQVLARR